MTTQTADKAETQGDAEAEVVLPAPEPKAPAGEPAAPDATDEAAKEPTLAELKAAYESEKSARIKAEHDRELAIKGQSASDKKLAAERLSKAQGPDYELNESQAKQIDALRGDGETTAQDEVKAHRSKVVASAGQADFLAAQQEMGAALAEAGITVDDFENSETHLALSTLWDRAMQRRTAEGYAAASRIAARVKASKVVAPVAAAPEKPKKSAAQRSAEMDNDGGPSGGSAGGKSWAAAQKITKVTDLSDADYEKLVAR